MPSIPIEAISALVGVLAGGLVTAGTTIYLETSREKRAAKQIAMAFYGEISALTEIVEVREYINLLEEVINHIQRTNQKFTFQIRITKNYFRVYEENIGKIGLLDKDIASQTASFYVKANSLLEDLRSLDEGYRDDGSVDDQLDFYRDMKRFFEDSMGQANSLCRALKRQYS